MAAPTNPLLDTLSLPRFAELSPDQIAPALDEAIARHEAMVEALTTARPTDFAGAWLPYERANTEIGAIWSAWRTRLSCARRIRRGRSGSSRTT
jgi:oligopeptidase A